MTTKKHPNKEIRAAVEYALSLNWELKMTGKSSHCWGKLYCPTGDRENGCLVFVYGTPRVPEDHANQITRAVKRCEHD